MATNKYIVLANSNASLSKQFRVLRESYLPVRARSQTVARTVTGALDITQGANTRRWQFTLRVNAVETGAYGTLDNLITLHALSNPGATPSDAITLTDAVGSVFTAYFVGELVLRNQTPMLDSSNAFYLVDIVLEQA